MKEIHETQLGILKNLLFSNELRFVDMKPDEEMENNTFVFHLDKLIAEGHIVKEAGMYRLSDQGKEYANQIDTDDLQIMKQAKSSAWIVCIRDNATEPEFLIYTRLKHPFYGAQGFPAGKIKYGEKIEDAAKRELKEETNLEGDAKLFSITHYINTKDQQVVEDKVMYGFMVRNPTGQLIPNDEGKYEWIKEKDFKKKIKKPFESYDRFLKEIDMTKSFKGNITFEEKKLEAKNF